MRPSTASLARTAAALLALTPLVTAQLALLPAAAAVAGLALIPPVAANTSASEAAATPAAQPAPGSDTVPGGAGKTCYFPAGNEAHGNVPCDPTAAVSACCGARANCLPNGLCKVPSTSNPNYVARGACTDSTWNSPQCVQHCQACESCLLVRDAGPSQRVLTRRRAQLRQPARRPAQRVRRGQGLLQRRRGLGLRVGETEGEAWLLRGIGRGGWFRMGHERTRSG